MVEWRLKSAKLQIMAFKCQSWAFKPKIRLWYCRESESQLVARHWELIFFLLTNPKCDFGEVEKAMFQGIA